MDASPQRKAEEGSDGSTGSSKDSRGSNDAVANSGGNHRWSQSYGGSEKGMFEYFGWVYHLGVNSIGHEYCHLRFLFIRGKYVEMYKRDPHDNPGIIIFDFPLSEVGCNCKCILNRGSNRILGDQMDS